MAKVRWNVRIAAIPAVAGAQRPCQRFGPSATPRSLARSDYSTAVCEDAPRFFARNCDAPNITKVLVGSL